MAFVDRIEGCYNNVVGLPTTKTIGLFDDYRQGKESGHG
jgi:predicted house-cleaning NTP pyrophosphatase (Maf/HAM1 superfamily)